MNYYIHYRNIINNIQSMYLLHNGWYYDSYTDKWACAKDFTGVVNSTVSIWAKYKAGIAISLEKAIRIQTFEDESKLNYA